MGRCGIQDKTVFHAWTCYLITESYIKLFLFNTDIVGHYNYERGIVSVNSVMWGGIAISFVYFWYLLDPQDPGFKLEWIYKLQFYTFLIAILSYTVDAVLWISLY